MTARRGAVVAMVVGLGCGADTGARPNPAAPAPLAPPPAVPLVLEPGQYLRTQMNFDNSRGYETIGHDIDCLVVLPGPRDQVRVALRQVRKDGRCECRAHLELDRTTASTKVWRQPEELDESGCVLELRLAAEDQAANVGTRRGGLAPPPPTQLTLSGADCNAACACRDLEPMTFSTAARTDYRPDDRSSICMDP